MRNDFQHGQHGGSGGASQPPPQPQRPRFFAMNQTKLRTKLHILAALPMLIAAILGVVGLVGIRNTNQALRTVYNDRVVPLKQLKTIADAYAVSIIDAVNKANAGNQTAEETLNGVVAASDAIKQSWKSYMATTLTPEEAGLAREAEKLFATADSAVGRLQQHLLGKSGSLKGALTDFDGPLYASIDPISAKITELVDLQLRVAEREYLTAERWYAILMGFCIFLLLGGLASGAALGWRIGRSIEIPIRQVADALTSAADQTVSAAGQVSTASQQLAEGAGEQAASLEETSSSLEELSSMTKRNADSAVRVNELAKQARTAAERGSSDMQAMSAAMDAIKASSDDIAKIIKTIDEIAFQTNILALNAAVEAARAGAAGMGFAVVADEVRNLAQRSAQAAKETSAKIEAAIGRSTQGVGLSVKVGQALAEIVAQARQVDELAAEVASASREQSQGISQVNVAMSQMDGVTQGVAANAEEGAAAAEELNAQAEALKGTVAELLDLVGGSASPAAAARPPAPAREPHSPTGRIAGAPAGQRSNGKHVVPPTPPAHRPSTAMLSTRMHLPESLPGDFKNF